MQVTSTSAAQPDIPPLVAKATKKSETPGTGAQDGGMMPNCPHMGGQSSGALPPNVGQNLNEQR